jgi:hypothetical protein
MIPITVHKLNTCGELAVTYDGMLAERLPGGVRIEARWTRPRLDLGYTTFDPDDRFVEWYFTDRWYNIFEVHTADGSLKGWYCNVAEPAAIAEPVITCRDLLLDVWVSPNGDTLTLDEDEFAADTTLDQTTREAALRALDALLQLIRARAFPFNSLPSESSARDSQ